VTAAFPARFYARFLQLQQAVEAEIGKTVGAVVGVALMIGIAIVAPMLAPIALGAIGITASATAVAIATAVISTTLALGVSIAMRALGVGVPSAKNAVGPPTMFRQSIANSFIVYGKRRVGGLMVFYHPRKNGDDHYRYFVIAVAGHRCQGVVTWMLGDDEVTVNGSNMVTSGKYNGDAWLWLQNGDASETANATFVSECGGKWTANHKGNGIAAIYAKFKLTDEVIQAGLPNITAIIEGRDEILDPRDATEKYTANGPLVFYDWMQLPREEGGFGAYADEIPDDDWISAQANVADETVNSEARYELNAVITTGAAPSEIRDVMVVNMAGSYTYSGGKHLMRPGYWVPVSKTLREDDLAGPIQVSPFMTGDVAANEVNGTYISPTDNYQGAPFTTQTIGAADVKQLDLDLAFTTSKHQAERIASIMLMRAQAEKTVVWPMNIAGLGVKAMDTVALDTSRYSLSNYAWSVGNWSLSPDWGVVLNLREENEDIYLEPGVVAAPTPPAIGTPETVETVRAAAALINTSSVVDPDPLTAVLTATETTIAIDDHIRRYDDRAVEVFGSAGASLRLMDGDNLVWMDGGARLIGPTTPEITGLTAETIYHVGYVDLARQGGAVTYIVSTDLADVTNSGAGGALPGMHYVGSIETAVAGSGGTNTGGGATPPGYNNRFAL
jgi:hypothetical protein